MTSLIHDMTKVEWETFFENVWYSQLGIRNEVNCVMLSYKQTYIAVFERRQSETCVFKASSSTASLAAE